MYTINKPFCKLKENRFKKRTSKQQKYDTNILEISKANPIKALIKYKVVDYLFHFYNFNYHPKMYSYFDVKTPDFSLIQTGIEVIKIKSYL